MVAAPMAFNPQTGGSKARLGYGERPTALQANQVTAVHTAPSATGFAENQRGEVVESVISHQITTGGGEPGQGYGAVRQESAVRRLTPLECERLQGFPDEWTRWLDDGTEQSDSARYRELGNAVAVPVVEWVAHRLAAAEACTVAEGAA
jgi:DNA (cytosine-5)-methyltransferase 1